MNNIQYTEIMIPKNKQHNATNYTTHTSRSMENTIHFLRHNEFYRKAKNDNAMLRNIQTDTTRPKKHREQLHATSRFKPPDHPFLVGAATNLQEFCIAPYQLQRWARKFDGWLKLFSCYMNSYWYFARKTCYFLFKGLKQAMLLYLRVSS